MQIVLARLDQDQEIVKQGRVDLGERHTFRKINKPVSLMWKNAGSEADVAKATKYAANEGYTVFCFEGEKDPLGRAKAEVMA